MYGISHEPRLPSSAAVAAGGNGSQPASRIERLVGLSDAELPREDCLPAEPLRSALTTRRSSDTKVKTAALQSVSVAFSTCVVGFAAAFFAVAALAVAMPVYARLSLILPEWNYSGPGIAAAIVLIGGFSAGATALHRWHQRGDRGAPLTRAITLTLAIIVATLAVVFAL